MSDDGCIIVAPMWNYGVPPMLKAYIDAVFPLFPRPTLSDSSLFSPQRKYRLGHLHEQNKHEKASRTKCSEASFYHARQLFSAWRIRTFSTHSLNVSTFPSR
ncbi:NAD(P)H-dependent oxidoreductase [Brevibacillus parabrevis]